MSIFGREDQPVASPSQQPATPAPSKPKVAARVTQISEGTRIEGEISGATEVKVDGIVEGRINVESTVRIEANGRVSGEIQAKTVSVAGKVVGNILGGDKVDIQPSGKLQGDVKAPRVSIADGAYFKGRVEMTGEAPARKKPAPKPAPKPQAKLETIPLSDSAK